jgi:membrane protein required for colicin V production
MTVFDYAVLTIIGLSIILSIMRGVVREVLSILGWVAAFYVARTYIDQLLPMMPGNIPTEALRVLAAFLVLFLATLLLVSLLSIALSAIVKRIGLNWLNRLFGAVFGVFRGVLIVCVLVLLAGLTDMPKDARWRNAMFSAPFEALVIAALPWMPSSIAEHINYE